MEVWYQVFDEIDASCRVFGDGISICWIIHYFVVMFRWWVDNIFLLWLVCNTCGV